jgi:RND family efflux transporter MFP subunit
LRADVPEKMAPWVRVGNAVELRVEAHPDRVFTGKVSRVSPSVDEQKRTFAVEALIPNGQNLLRPGFYAKAVIQTQKRERVLSIPVRAVIYAYGSNKAFVINGGKVAARDLKLGERFGDTVEVVEGLQGDEQVALSELDRLDNGTPVITLEK